MNPILVLALMAAIPLVGAFVIVRRRNRQAPVDRAPAIIYLTQLVGVTSAGWATFMAVVTGPLIFQRLTGVHTTASVAAFSPWALPPTPPVDSAEPYVMHVNIEQLRTTVAQADIGTQVLQASGLIVSALPMITLGIFVALLCERIIRRSPFAAQLARLSWIGAGVVLVAGFAGQLLSGYASFRLSNIAFGLLATENPGAPLPTPIWPGPLDLWPLWGALALGVLAVLIKHGARLQRDTEGLV